MRWRKFNGESLHLPIKDAVEEAIKKNLTKAYILKFALEQTARLKATKLSLPRLLCFA